MIISPFLQTRLREFRQLASITQPMQRRAGMELLWALAPRSPLSTDMQPLLKLLLINIARSITIGVAANII